MGLLDHKELQIIKGIGPTPGDTASAEQPLVVIDLLQENSGISVIEWSPNIPSLKNGGVWADSPISDGRLLTAGAETNVIETMVLQLSGNVAQVVATRFNQLRRMAQDARLFWDSQWQIEPVYLKWWANGAPGAQYALISNIDMDNQFEDSNDSQNRITLSIEREYGWAGVAPAGNAKEWTYSPSGKNLGLFSASHAELLTGSDHIISQALQNRREWNAAQTALTSQNHITIPGEDIPGDLPALAYIGVTVDSGTGAILYVGRSIKPDMIARDNGAVRTPNYILNACDGGLGTDASAVADTGAPRSGASALQLRARITFATPTDATRITWSATSRGYVDDTLTRGRYMVFLRARLSTGSSNVNLHLNIAPSIGVNDIELPTTSLSDQGSGGTGNTTYWPISYLGVLTIPTGESRALANQNGLGLNVISSGGGMLLRLYAERTTGAADLYISDLILIPIDEAAYSITSGVSSGVGTGNAFVMDGTRYHTHGRPEEMVITGGAAPPTTPFPAILAGQAITLEPKVDNHLHFLMALNLLNSPIDLEFTPRINIVPRWSGIRDA